MSLTVKAATIAFQLSNGLNYNKSELISRCDEEMGSSNELYNYRLTKMPSLFDYFNFALGFCYNGAGFVCNYSHFNNYMNNLYYNHKELMKNQYDSTPDDDKFIKCTVEWTKIKTRYIFIKLVEFIGFTIIVEIFNMYININS